MRALLRRFGEAFSDCFWIHEGNGSGFGSEYGDDSGDGWCDDACDGVNYE